MQAKKYKIAIDVSPLYNGNSIRGVGYYTSRLVEYLQRAIKNNPEYCNFQIDLVKEKNQISQTKYDLIHYPYFDHFQLTIPFNPPAPYIISLHDLTPIEFPDHFPVGIKGKIKWLIQKSVSQRAKYLITISNHSKKIINKITGYSLDHIFVTYLAADSAFKPRKMDKSLKSIKEKYNLPDRFVFYIGDVNWNKNLPALAQACLDLDIPFVLGGGSVVKEVPDHPWTADIRQIQKLHKQVGGNKTQKIILPGFIPDEELPYFFNLATIYCLPSFSEGFGLGQTQAMQSGCPVAVSNLGATKEVIKDAGELFNPYSVDSIKASLNKLWNDPQLCRQLAKKGINRAKFFTWEKTADATLAVYKLALNQHD